MIKFIYLLQEILQFFEECDSGLRRARFALFQGGILVLAEFDLLAVQLVELGLLLGYF